MKQEISSFFERKGAAILNDYYLDDGLKKDGNLGDDETEDDADELFDEFAQIISRDTQRHSFRYDSIAFKSSSPFISSDAPRKV